MRHVTRDFSTNSINDYSRLFLVPNSKNLKYFWMFLSVIDYRQKFPLLKQSAKEEFIALSTMAIEHW